ncbi:hypothetical protein PC110_g12270 [Phytophthora cactorum]|nr:hypothetical protein PC110_g12270 [Phytophthora cactorum]
MPAADHPQTDGQTKRLNRVLVNLLKGYAHSFQQWRDCLLMAEFAMNNSMHASSGHTPFYKSADTDTVSVVTTRRQVRGTASCPGNETSNKNYGSAQGTDSAQAGPVAGTIAVLNTPFSTQAIDFVQRRQAVIRFVEDAIAASVDRQKLNADNVGRGNTNEFEKGSLVLLATQNLPRHAVLDFGASLLAPRFIGPFTVLERHGNTYTLDIPSSMRLQPTFYVGRLKPYTQNEPSSPDGSKRMTKRPLKRSNAVVEPRDLRYKRHLGVRHGLGGLHDLCVLVAQLLLQLRALEQFQGGYTVVQSARVTINLGLTVRKVSFRPRRRGSFSFSVIIDGAAIGGEVAPDLEAISDARGTHGGRFVATERGEEGVTCVGGFTSSLRKHFQLEAFGSSSRGRREPVAGSCVTTTNWESAVEVESSSLSMGTSLMSDR